MIKIVNTRSRYERNKVRTMIIILDKQKLAEIKTQKKNDSTFEINLWDAIHYW